MLTRLWRERPWMLISRLIHSAMILFTLVTMYLFWTNNISILPEYKTKYILTGVLIIGFGAAMKDLLAPNAKSVTATAKPNLSDSFPVITYPVPFFIVSQFLRAIRLPAQGSWIPYSNSIFAIALLAFSIFTWYMLFQDSKQETHDDSVHV